MGITIKYSDVWKERPDVIGNLAFLISVLMFWSFSVEASCKEASTGKLEKLHGHMNGLVWRVGKYVGIVSLDGKDVPFQMDVPNPDNWVSEPEKNQRIAGKIDEYLSEQKDIKGLLIYVTWAELEREQGVYDWDFLDRVITVARKNKVFYKLSLMPGLHCPEWIYEKGAEEFPFIDHNRPVKIPVPWQEQYLKYFTDMLREVSRRYSNDKYFYAVALTGASWRFDEMHLPATPDDLARWKTYGDYKGKLVDLYRHLTDTFVEIFPHQQICPHIKLPLPEMEYETRQMIEYGVRTYPERFTLQNNQLHGRNDNTENITYRIIMDNDYPQLFLKNLAGKSYK